MAGSITSDLNRIIAFFQGIWLLLGMGNCVRGLEEKW